MKKLIALLSALALLAAACGSGSDAADDTSDDSATQTTAGDDSSGDDDGEEPTTTEAPAPEAAAGDGGTLSLLQWQAPSQANSLLSNGTKDLLAGSLVLEPLAEYAPDGSLIPALAVEIPSASNGGISEDLTQITWQVRDDIMWSDGTPLTADDVVFTYEYCADEATGCSVQVFADVTSVVDNGDSSVTITFDAPKPYPFSPFVGYTTPVIQRAQFADCVGAAAQACSDQNFMPVGTGPYMVTELRPEDTVTYEMNPNYRGIADGKPFFGAVELKGGGDAEASARSVLEIGEADYAWNLQVAPEILGPMEQAGQGEVAVAFTTNVEHINLNQTNNRADGDLSSDYQDGANPHPILFNNPELARALSLGIDRDLLVQVGYGANGSPTCNIWNVGSGTSANNDWCLTRDVDQANQILDDLGYLDTDGDGVRETDDGLPLEFSYATSTNAVRQSNQEIIKANWEEIGVAVNMENVDASIFFDGTNAQQSIWRFPTDMEMFTNGASSPDPAGYLSGWITDEIPTLETAWGGSNMPRLSSEAYDALYLELAATPLDDPDRDDMAIRLNDLLTNEGAMIPLILRGNVSAFSTDIAGQGELNGWDSEYWNIEEWTRTG